MSTGDKDAAKKGKGDDEAKEDMSLSDSRKPLSIDFRVPEHSSMKSVLVYNMLKAYFS